MLTCVLALGPGTPPIEAAETVGGAVIDLSRIAASEEEIEKPAARNMGQLVPVGKTVGIKLFADGVMLVALSKINTASGYVSPAETAGLKEGDMLTQIGSQQVTSADQFIETIAASGGSELSVQYVRNGKTSQARIKPAVSDTDGEFKIGAWIRDSMAGIGTVTFYDPETKAFGALGHGINDVDTLVLMPIQKGSVMSSSVESVNKGAEGKPGELKGVFDLYHDLGDLYANTNAGVFGVAYDADTWQGDAMPIASMQEVKTGPATILSNVSGESVEEYEIELVRVESMSYGSNKNMLIKVKDPRLIERTGGIVQGMSGSPILQNGKFIGAVTHVLVNDPTMGYGIFIENMLSAAYDETNMAAS